jgi:hypothetical protein
MDPRLISHTHFPKKFTVTTTGWSCTIIILHTHFQTMVTVPATGWQLILITHFLKLWYLFYIRICVFEKLLPYHPDRPYRENLHHTYNRVDVCMLIDVQVFYFTHCCCFYYYFWCCVLDILASSFSIQKSWHTVSTHIVLPRPPLP